MKARKHKRGEEYFIIPDHLEEGVLPTAFEDVTKHLGKDGEETSPPDVRIKTSALPITLMRLRETVISLGIQDITHVVLCYDGTKMDAFQLTRDAFETFMEHRENVPFAFTPFHRIGREGKVHVYTVMPGRALRLKGWERNETTASGETLLARQKRG